MPEFMAARDPTSGSHVCKESVLRHWAISSGPCLIFNHFFIENFDHESKAKHNDITNTAVNDFQHMLTGSEILKFELLCYL